MLLLTKCVVYQSQTLDKSSKDISVRDYHLVMYVDLLTELSVNLFLVCFFLE